MSMIINTVLYSQISEILNSRNLGFLSTDVGLHEFVQKIQNNCESLGENPVSRQIIALAVEIWLHLYYFKGD